LPCVGCVVYNFHAKEIYSQLAVWIIIEHCMYICFILLHLRHAPSYLVCMVK
jgi:hypothetical protein